MHFILNLTRSTRTLPLRNIILALSVVSRERTNSRHRNNSRSLKTMRDDKNISRREKGNEINQAAGVEIQPRAVNSFRLIRGPCAGITAPYLAHYARRASRCESRRSKRIACDIICEDRALSSSATAGTWGDYSQRSTISTVG
ncbi:unnamed protein product [Leptosia nina]|uniref:Uncharacterized protein n=1 Tax=Leptosia nina TaxID=320188 RepID=A0AAV1IS99_9NEOP